MSPGGCPGLEAGEESGQAVGTFPVLPYTYFSLL